MRRDEWFLLETYPCFNSMGKRKKRRGKTPLLGWKPLTSQRQARRVTSAFHKITAAIDEAQKASHNGKDPQHAQTAQLKRALTEMGGREAYQNASILLTGLNKRSAKWTFQSLTSLGMRPKKGEPPLSVLEVGAVNTQLLSCPWLSVRAIDLASRHPHIEQLDFFALKPQGNYACVVNAMVINCVPTPQQRGRMLKLCNAHLQLNGVLILVLPRRCVDASKEMTEAHLFSILNTLGFSLVKHERSAKILYVTAVKARGLPESEEAEGLSAAAEKGRGGSSSTFAIEI